MSGHFKIKNRINLDEVSMDVIIPESDYSTLTPAGNFVQLEYNEDAPVNYDYEFNSGIFSIVKRGNTLGLQKTEFTQDKILETLISTQQIENIADCFFSKFDIYKKYGIEIPKRGIILHGIAGSGKTSTIVRIAEKYAKDGKTVVIIWGTDNFSPSVVKDFIKTFKYSPEVEKMILMNRVCLRHLL